MESLFFYLLLEPFLPFTEFNMAQPYSSPAAVPPGLEYLSQVSTNIQASNIICEDVHNNRYFVMGKCPLEYVFVCVLH